MPCGWVFLVRQFVKSHYWIANLGYPGWCKVGAIWNLKCHWASGTDIKCDKGALEIVDQGMWVKSLWQDISYMVILDNLDPKH